MPCSPMKINDSQLRSLLDEVLHEIDEEEIGVAARTLRPILEGNLEACRIQRFLDEQEDGEALAAYLRRYVHRVATHYDRWHEHVHRVQVAKATEVWEPLYVLLQKWAYAFLRRRNFAAEGGRYEHALACAGEAAAALIDARFPYDVHFERWAYVILQNICRRYIDRHWSSTDAMDRAAVPLDEWEDWTQNLADPGAERDVDRVALRHDLLQAIEDLASDARMELILLHYFQQLSLGEIADRMGRKRNAIYKLHFDALDNLSKIWQEKQDNNE